MIGVKFQNKFFFVFILDKCISKFEEIDKDNLSQFLEFIIFVLNSFMNEIFNISNMRITYFKGG